MKAIVAVDSNWGIGYQGNLLLRIPEDMRNFRQITSKGVVVMGRTTFESLPGKAPLKDRINIVLSRDESFLNSAVTICRSIDELYTELGKYNNPDVFIIGGESVYRQLLPFCDEAFVTRIENEFTADKFFPNLDLDKSWKLLSSSEDKNFDDIHFSFLHYQRSPIREV